MAGLPACGDDTPRATVDRTENDADNQPTTAETEPEVSSRYLGLIADLEEGGQPALDALQAIFDDGHSPLPRELVAAIPDLLPPLGAIVAREVALGDDDEQANFGRNMAVTLLRRMRDHPGIADALAGALGDPFLAARISAALELEDLGDPRGKATIDAALIDVDERVRVEAAVALADERDERGIQALLTIAGEGELRFEAAEALASTVSLGFPGTEPIAPFLDAALAAGDLPVVQGAWHYFFPAPEGFESVFIEALRTFPRTEDGLISLEAVDLAEAFLNSPNAQLVAAAEAWAAEHGFTIEQRQIQ